MKKILAAAALSALALPAAAAAHVTVHPNKLPAGQFTVTGVRVPNEKDDASTTKVDVQMPDGIASASTQPRDGWTAKVTMEKAAKPIEMHGETSTEEVARITWTADEGAGVRPGEFVEFPVSLRVPDGAGSTLAFKALQTYSDGEVVRWIGAADSERPAPAVAVVAEDAVLEDVPAGASAEAQTQATPAAQEEDDDGPSTGLVIAALVLGGLGLLAGLAGLMAARRRPAAG
jgi:uncharacterized protein